MYEGNPGEIDFGSSLREVRVSDGASYRESTVFLKLLLTNDPGLIFNLYEVSGRLVSEGSYNRNR